MRVIATRLSDLLERNDKRTVKEYLGGFRCTRGADLQEFLWNKAIMYEDKGRSRTYLFVDADADGKIVGYVTLSMTKISVTAKSVLTGGIVRKMDLHNGETVGYLIGQMAKDDTVTEHIGGTMLKFSENMLYISYRQNGGRVICIDCKKELLEFYAQEGFTLVEPEPDERSGLYRLVKLF